MMIMMLGQNKIYMLTNTNIKMIATIPTSAQETLKGMIRTEFDKTEWYDEDKKNDLVNIALIYGFDELVDEMLIDWAL